MHRIKRIYFLIIVLAFSSCIEPYQYFGSNSTAKYVVEGEVNDQEGYQTVSISLSSLTEIPQKTPLTGCNVKIIDNNGNEFSLDEFKAGNYRVWIEKEYLKSGNSYQVNIKTASGEEIVSDFDQMPECPEIDSIYYVREDLPTTNPDNTIQGVRFYIDVDRKNTNSNYYRWDIEETWEHHAKYPLQWYWNRRKFVEVSPPDYSNFFCWTTQKIKKIFALSTVDLAQKKYSMFPLHFVDNQTQRLTYCYSLLIKQFTISESAYKFWKNLQINNYEQGGLYNTIPLRAKGNLKNLTNPEQDVLGFFSANTVRSRRIFIRNVQNIDLCYPYCVVRDVEKQDFNNLIEQYVIKSHDGTNHIPENSCIECGVNGGTTKKPDYWPYTPAIP